MKNLIHTSLLALFFSIVFCGFLTACHSKNNNQVIKVGVISGPEADLMNVVKDVALKKYNLQIKVVEFSDYITPNISLDDGSIDANMFQHQPYLDQVIKNRQYRLTAIGKTFIYPVGIYSKKINNIQQVQNNAIVAIPNDPSNEARALLLLQQAGLIKLKPGTDTSATILDIVSNPKKLQFKELDAAQLPRALPDVTLAVINTNYAISSGLLPQKDAIFHENADSPYANLIVVKTADANKPEMKLLVKAFQSPEVLTAAQRLFNGGAVPAWK